MDRTAAIHELPVQCGSALASYPWLLPPVFVACSTNAKLMVETRNEILPPTSYGKAHYFAMFVDEGTCNETMFAR